MRIGLIAMSGIRVHNEALRALGVTLPGFVRRGQIIAALPSLGLLTVAGLTPPEYELEYIEFDTLEAASALPVFDLVAISSLSARIFDAYALADRYRAAGTKVVLGGLHVSCLPDEAQPHADAIVIDGAEGAWPLLLSDLKRNQLKPRYMGARERVFEADLYARPRFELLGKVKRAYNRLTIQSSRGCPRDCTFCGASLRIASGFNRKCPSDVLAEIRAARTFIDQPYFEFADDNTFLDKAWAKRLLRDLIPEQIRYFAETDASIAEDPELCDLLAASGCRQVLIGFESPHEQDLRGIDPMNWKRSQADRIKKVVDDLQSRGVSVNGCFILGLDNHTPDTFPRVLDFVRQSGMADVQFTVLTPFPGTPLYTDLQRQGRLLEERFWDRCTLFDVNYRPKNMSVEELESGLYWLFKEAYSSTAVAQRRRLYARSKLKFS